MKINTHTSHPSAFISSTFIDLEEERSAVADVLRKANLNINALDIKPASSDSSKKEILSGIKESDFLVLIVGERYGSIIPKMTSSSKLSITRWEYKRAVNGFKKDVLVFFKKVGSTNPKYYDDKTSCDYDLKRRLLAEFKRELAGKHNPKYFSSPEELAEEIGKAIIPTYRTGVKTLAEKNDHLLREIERLKKENERLVAGSISSNGNKVNNNSLLDGLATRSEGGLRNVLSGGSSALGLSDMMRPKVSNNPLLDGLAARSEGSLRNVLSGGSSALGLSDMVRPKVSDK